MIYKGKELYHYGTKGQKWGIRNYQNKDGSYTANGQKENNGHGRYSSIDSENKSNKKRGLSDKQKKYIKIGLAVAGVSLAVAGGLYLYKNKDYLSMYMKMGKKNVDFIRNSGTFDYLNIREDKDAYIVDPNNILQKTSTSGKLSEALKNVNPSGEKDHCQQNVVAACLRYMGLDAKTKSGALSTTSGSIVTKCFKGDDMLKARTPNVTFSNSKEASDWIIKRLKPIEGSCGSISLPLVGTTEGHAIMWSMDNGAIKFSDPFARTKNGFIVIEDASSYFGSLYSTTERPTISRIDNLEINYEEFWNYFTN